jgi:hypothetical protein
MALGKKTTGAYLKICTWAAEADTCHSFKLEKKGRCLQLTKHNALLAALAGCQHAVRIQLPSTCLNTRSNIKSRERVWQTRIVLLTNLIISPPSLGFILVLFAIRSFFSSYALHYLVSLVFPSFCPLKLFLSFSPTSFRSLPLIFPFLLS